MGGCQRACVHACVRGDRLYFFEIEARCVRGMFILCHDIIYLVDKMSVEIQVEEIFEGIICD